MKIVIAPDSFKDSLDAAGVARAIAAGLAEVWPDAERVECPMADGGEGTMDAILAAREALEHNVAPLLAMESLMLTLADPDHS